MLPRSTVPLCVVMALASVPAGAQNVISFDELPASNCNCMYLTGEYSALGIQFVTTDDGSTWGGISNGDPGNWQLEGTNGPAFLGFNGASYSASATFASSVSGFRLDVSGSNGSMATDTFTLEGLQGGMVVESVTVPLPGVNAWTTVQLSSTVDGIRMTGGGGPFHPFGLDNFQWSGGAFTALCFGDGSGTACPCANPGGADEGCANSGGGGASLIATGSNSLAAGDAVLTVAGALPGQPGLFFQGNVATAGGNGLAFGDGLRCCGMSVVRLQVALPDVNGDASSSVDVGVTGGALPGDTKCYQFWYRDPVGGPCGLGFNLTNAVRTTWEP